MDNLISRLSELRSQYSCFDENERGAYHTLSEAIEALKEPWAQHLMYCDMEGFAILEDGTLMLTDECGKYEFCPEGRFVVKWEVEQDG